MSTRKELGIVSLTAGVLALVLCWLLWEDWSNLAEVLGWIALLWGLMLISWGLILTWLESPVACLLGAAAGTASAVLAVMRAFVYPPWTSMFVVCVVGGGLGFLVGLIVGIYRLRAQQPR